jgi:predicted double-glycine peptidase
MNLFLFLLLSTYVITQEDLRYSHMYKQEFDTSCGMATTTTLLSKYWGIPVVEADMYQEIIVEKEGNGEQDYTINFVNMGEYMLKYGIQAQAFKMDWDELVNTLEKGFSPIIVNYQFPTAHFVLLLHIERDHAYVADPARGLEIIDQKTFVKWYSGNVLLTASRAQQKNEGYIQNVIQETRQRHNRLDRITHIQGRRQ